jgi:hypothetical protein
MESEFDSVLTANCRLDGSPGPADRGGDSASFTASLLMRNALAAKGWYWGWGIQAENYLFNDSGVGPRRLQDYAGLFTLEYFQADEKAAALTLHPGWYFENHPVPSAWDVPVDLVTGIPISGAIDGVIGFSNGRFYHHALPIFGVVWTVGPRVRIEAVYPEPALVLTLSPTTSLRFGGELGGAGFLGDPRPERTVIEYSSYRVGAEFGGDWRPGLHLALAAGVEADRSFDYFSQHYRLHGGGAGYVKISATLSR